MLVLLQISTKKKSAQQKKNLPFSFSLHRHPFYCVLTYLTLPPVDISVADSEQTPLTSSLEAGHGRERANSNDRLKAISGAIAEGAQSFLKTEYIYISVFCVVFSLVIGWVLPSNSWATAFSFLWGSATSVLCGYIGMMTAVKANVRVCVCCVRSSAEGFLAAFQGGAVMGFALCSIGLANLLILIAIMNAWLPAEADAGKIVPAFVGRFEV
jgi:Na+/H+-translocating membrane pyrophosphatase